MTDHRIGSKAKTRVSDPLVHMERPKTVVGIDLAGSPNRPTGVCTLRGRTALDIAVLYRDDEILQYLEAQCPSCHR